MLTSWEEALAARRPWEREYRLHHRSGEYRWINDRGVPRYVGGHFVGYVGTAIDIHERKTMEARLLEVYQREHRIAETLQRSLLPERLPPIEGLEMAARYLPGARGAAIGGDWYDVLERPDGRVALVVGDVVGHGLRAAASMGQLRNAFRAYGMVEASPAEVVARINRLVMSGVERGDGDGALPRARPRDRRGLVQRRAATRRRWCSPPTAPRFLEGGRSVPIGAAEPAVFREATRGPAAGLLAAALHRRAGGAPRRAARRAPRAARRGGRRGAGDDLEASASACSAGARRRAIPATTWRSWRCARCRWRAERSA